MSGTQLIHFCRLKFSKIKVGEKERQNKAMSGLPMGNDF